jgi:hypothetical protein
MGMPARAQTAKRDAVSKLYSLPAPTGGLNGISSLATMPETDAIVMDNWFPQPGWVELRNGYSQWSTGLPGWVETLMPYSNGSGEKLFGISSGKIYDVTAQGAVGAALVSGLSNAQWEWTQVATAGGQFLYAANAADKPQLYNGTAFTAIDGASTPAITGVTTTTLRNPIVWKNRVWFVQDGTLSAWYLPTASVGGAAQQFNFTAIFKRGGTLQAIFTASLSDGSTFDDYIGFVTTEGEIALYRGTDPAQAGMFNEVGVYNSGKPVGRRCTCKFGADTLLLTSDGLVSVTKLFGQGRVNTQDAISFKIQSLINDDIQAYNANFGWEAVLYPLGNKLIVNVPVNTESVIYQYVMNTLNNSWCNFGRFSSPWNPATFCVLGNTLYFGGNTFVAQADIGQADNGAAITGLLKTAFTSFKTVQQKQMMMVRPTLQANGNVQAVLGINVNYGDMQPQSAPTIPSPTGSPWDTSSWNTSSWTSGYSISSNWQSAAGVGFNFSTYLSVSSNAVQARLMALDYLYQPGGVL